MSPALPLLALVLLAGCAAAPPTRFVVMAVPPPELASCAGRVTVPPAPRAPRTVEAIARWGTALDAALVRSEAARAECARRLSALWSWTEQHRTPEAAE